MDVFNAFDASIIIHALESSNIWGGDLIFGFFMKPRLLLCHAATNYYFWEIPTILRLNCRFFLNIDVCQHFQTPLFLFQLAFNNFLKNFNYCTNRRFLLEYYYWVFSTLPYFCFTSWKLIIFNILLPTGNTCVVINSDSF